MLIEDCWDTPGTGRFCRERQSHLHLNALLYRTYAFNYILFIY